jgi:hypothetical protein
MLIIKMEKLQLEGFYNYAALPEGKGNLTGEIELAKDGSFEGEIYDHASMTPNQFIKGHSLTEGGLEKLAFLKFPPSAMLANLAYGLTKESTGSVEGTYNGNWKALPYRVSFNEDCGLFIAELNNPFAYDPTVDGLGDKAQISLHRK